MKSKLLVLFEESQIHKVFLVLGMSLGTMLCLFMPLFNEPDGQYHLAVSGRIANNIIDTSRYGDPAVASGMLRQKQSYKDGTHFEKYYLNKAYFVKPSSVPRNIRYSKIDFVYWGHIVPAIGLKVGKLIYPSIGVMITAARLTSLIVCVSTLYAIIKRLKAAKYIYFFVFLSPVALNSFASLSYDATGFVLVALFISIVINTIVDGELTKRRRLRLYFSGFLLIIGAKWNYWLLLVWLPFLEYHYNPVLEFLRQKLAGVKAYLWSGKKRLLLVGTLAAFLMLAVMWILSIRHGGLLVVIRRFIMTFAYSYAGLGVHNNDLTSWLASPYPTFNFMPTWTTSAWYLFLFLVLLAEDKFIRSKRIAYFALGLFLIGVIGVFYIMLDYNGASTSYIEGVQGRYFTPTLVLLQLFFSGIKPGLNQYAKKLIPIGVGLLAIASNILLLFDTVVALIMR
ncbi:DUF2142 domain-containing protein [Streptococcus sp. ZJ151]|uniref:DUF2142 domain-containing protein n=1 Tax=Streptococcus jiangjianxini TaxID=3161189 RepID=UPI0032EB2BA6